MTKYSDLIITSMVSGQSVSFKAYITDMTQTFSSTWNTEDVFGRNDPIAMFQGTKRSISISLDVPAGSKTEAENNLKNCSTLATFLYPGYEFNTRNASSLPTGDAEWDEDGIIIQESSAGGAIGNNMVAAPLVKIKFTNLIDGMGELAQIEGLLGFIDSYTFTPTMEAGMFGAGPMYPRSISISFNLNVLHQTETGFKDGSDGEGSNIVWAAKKLPFS
jgi:hypothetical protein